MLVFELDTKYEVQNYHEGMTDEEFLHFCMENKNLRIERDKDRNIIIMPPLTGNSSHRDGEAYFYVKLWTNQHTGRAFNSSAGYKLPNGAVRSPDASWVHPEKWAVLTPEEKDGFLPTVPDFLIEVRSKSDGLKRLKEKMQEWMENGVCLAWLINPQGRNAIIYRENGETEVVEGFHKTLNGEDVMPGFELNLKVFENP